MKKLYSVSEARKRVHVFMNRRIRTWQDMLLKQDLAIGTASVDTIVEKDENGEIFDYGETNHEWSFSDDRKNPFHQDPLEVILANEEQQVFEKALQVIARRRTRRSREYMAIIAMILDRPGLADCSILTSLTNYQKNILTFHARTTLSKIVDKLYPVTKSGRHKKHRIRRTPFKNLKENRRGSTPLFNKNEKNGEVIIVFSRDNGQSMNISDADNSDHSSELNHEGQEIP